MLAIVLFPSSFNSLLENLQCHAQHSAYVLIGGVLHGDYLLCGNGHYNLCALFYDDDDVHAQTCDVLRSHVYMVGACVRSLELVL